MLRSISAYLRHRDRVLADWGYERTVARTQGLKVLFAGESGTGKTMAAQVLAAELGMELFRVDLATVVSKYIGETEKNLERIFTAADGSNAILFFDEADALFGKRSEVGDSHDRYANIEVAYLLQRMEAYPGAVILATNFKRNIDDAFIRRLDFVIDFPFPEADDRRRIWRLLLPEEAPVAEDVDIDFLATQFKLSGGAIRNCSLAAAFQAADEDAAIEMRHLVRAVAQEYGKQGRLTLEADFERFHEFVRTGGGNGGAARRADYSFFGGLKCVYSPATESGTMTPFCSLSGMRLPAGEHPAGDAVAGRALKRRAPRSGRAGAPGRAAPERRVCERRARRSRAVPSWRPCYPRSSSNPTGGARTGYGPQSMAATVDVPLNTVIADLDEALRRLLRRELERHGFEGVEIAFDAPSKDWSGKLTSPTVDLFLYDLREATERASMSPTERRGNGQRLDVPAAAAARADLRRDRLDEGRRGRAPAALPGALDPVLPPPPAGGPARRGHASAPPTAWPTPRRRSGARARRRPTSGAPSAASTRPRSTTWSTSSSSRARRTERGPEVRTQTLRTRIADGPARTLTELHRLGGTLRDAAGRARAGRLGRGPRDRALERHGRGRALPLRADVAGLASARGAHGGRRGGGGQVLGARRCRRPHAEEEVTEWASEAAP